jgi:2-polyprenyl-3-methyl-5-hydroxy-6-metoxy-1,4-benzoquinol methylase
MSDFYDQMASLYHLIFPNWDESIERQAEQLTTIISQRWGAGAKTILDVSCGIGTQAIGLAKRDFQVTGSDLSGGAIARAKVEALRRGVEIDFSVCDMRAIQAHQWRLPSDRPGL